MSWKDNNLNLIIKKSKINIKFFFYCNIYIFERLKLNLILGYYHLKYAFKGHCYFLSGKIKKAYKYYKKADDIAYLIGRI